MNSWSASDGRFRCAPALASFIDRKRFHSFFFSRDRRFAALVRATRTKDQKNNGRGKVIEHRTCSPLPPGGERCTIQACATPVEGMTR